MTYDFSFDGKSIGALLACSVILCVLLFFAGVLVGAGWNTKPDSRVAAQAEASAGASRATAQPIDAAQPAAAFAPSPNVSSATPPREPVLYDDPMRRDYAAQGYDAQYDARGYGSQSYGSPPQSAQQQPPARAYAAPDANALATQSAAGAGTGAQPSSFNGMREAERLRVRGIDPDPRVVEEAGTAPDATSRAVAQGFSVQVGAYLDERDARRLAGELENKGYTPIVFSGSDSEARVWYAVRIGAYANTRDASRAANNFMRQERRKADVRPAGSL